jgi:hypothetical protein
MYDLSPSFAVLSEYVFPEPCEQACRATLKYGSYLFATRSYCTQLCTAPGFRVHTSVMANAVLAKIKEDFPCLAFYENTWITIDVIKIVLMKTVAEHGKKMLKKRWVSDQNIP